MTAITPEQQLSNIIGHASSICFDIKVFREAHRTDDLLDTVFRIHAMWHKYLDGELKPITWKELRDASPTLTDEELKVNKRPPYICYDGEQ